MRGEVVELGRDAAVDFDADVDAETRRVLADLMECPADLAERGVEVGSSGNAVGPDFHARRTDVVCQSDIFLGPVDVLAHDGRVGRLVLERASQPGEVHGRVFKSLADRVALGLGQIDFDLVGVRRPQLDAGVSELFESGQDRGEVPILGDVVGDDSELRHGYRPREDVLSVLE